MVWSLGVEEDPIDGAVVAFQTQKICLQVTIAQIQFCIITKVVVGSDPCTPFNISNQEQLTSDKQ